MTDKPAAKKAPAKKESEKVEEKVEEADEPVAGRLLDFVGPTQDDLNPAYAPPKDDAEK